MWNALITKMLRSDWDSQIPASGPGMLPFFTRPSPSRSDGWGLGTRLKAKKRGASRDVHARYRVVSCPDPTLFEEKGLVKNDKILGS